MSRTPVLSAWVTIAVLATAGALASENTPAMDQMPVKEITVFKDGHAFVLHEGVVATDQQGDVVLDRLPRPVIGTFWPYARQPGAELSSVVAGRRAVSVDQPAMDVSELLEANLTKRVRIRETDCDHEYAAVIRSFPKRDAEGDKPAERGDIIILDTEEGSRIVPISRIRDVTFLDEPSLSIANSQLQDSMTLHLDWKGANPQPSAHVGMAYLERGIRWIPCYRIEIDGNGSAHVELQATLINEMVDLDNVVAHLVVGAPTFAFRDTVDPISLQQTVAQLSSYFQEGGQTAYAFSNAMMTQSARMQEVRTRSPRPANASTTDLGPDIGIAGKNEDLFIFTIKGISLKKGERMVLPVVQFDLKYQDVYTLNLPVMPPIEIRRSFNSQQQAELAKLLHRPKFLHQLRLTNNSRFPLTTAPALLFNQQQLIAQGMMTYTAIGGVSSIELTKAVDLRMNHAIRETKRTPNAMKVNSDSFSRVDLTGTISVTNYLDKPVEIEVVRQVLGNLDQADHQGTIASLDVLDQSLDSARGPSDFLWHNWYAWPWWWRHVNGRGSATWQLKLQPDESIDLQYAWHYFWH